MLVTGRKLPIGIQTFEDIRNDGYLYVDTVSYTHLTLPTIA